ncbi:MAG: VOC family protein [Eubacteriales bacterium]|jgi:lactoylglutathione lyase|nr:VOC family protein [Eubacteriales bacterium]MDD4133769.1 VOC family protein [Eubacteriales bacterium]NLO12906.1 lactoylglutathione lyase [Clostridiales bacterium]
MENDRKLHFTFAHNNFNVVDLEKSLDFYSLALGLEEISRKEAEGFTIVYLGDGITSHMLELTWLKDFDRPRYNLGDNEVHLAMKVKDMDAALEKHRAMDVVCFENPAMGIYFISDPDGYWIEIVPDH